MIDYTTMRSECNAKRTLKTWYGMEVTRFSQVGQVGSEESLQ